MTDSLCKYGAFSNPNAVRDCPFNRKGHGFYPGVGCFFVCSAIVFKAFQTSSTT
jgi:hypothetical protein